MMKTYWLTGEDASRSEQRVMRGMQRLDRTNSGRNHVERQASLRGMERQGSGSGGRGGGPARAGSFRRMDRTGSIRRRNIPTTPTTNNGSGSRHPSVSHSNSGGKIADQSPTLGSHLHPYSFMLGPTSEDLIRRTSSRRRRLIAQESLDIVNTLPVDSKELEPLEFTSDNLPTIVHGHGNEGNIGNIDQGGGGSSTLDVGCPHGTHGHTPYLSCNSFSSSHSGSGESGSVFIAEPRASSSMSSQVKEGSVLHESDSTDIPGNTASHRILVPKVKAPIVTIESFDFDSPSISPSIGNQGSSSCDQNQPPSRVLIPADPILQDDQHSALVAQSSNTTQRTPSPDRCGGRELQSMSRHGSSASRTSSLDVTSSCMVDTVTSSSMVDTDSRPATLSTAPNPQYKPINGLSASFSSCTSLQNNKVSPYFDEPDSDLRFDCALQPDKKNQNSFDRSSSPIKENSVTSESSDYQPVPGVNIEMEAILTKQQNVDLDMDSLLTQPDITRSSHMFPTNTKLESVPLLCERIPAHSVHNGKNRTQQCRDQSDRV